MKIFILYLLIINGITCILYGIDKWKAKHHKWRIREAVLILMACIGGSIGALFGMHAFHHKTKHLKFKIGIPEILGVQILLIGGLFWYRSGIELLR